MMANKPDITILTVREAAEYLRVHESSIYRLSKEGKIPAYKVGRGWRFKKDKIDEWLHQSQINIEEENKEPFGET